MVKPGYRPYPVVVSAIDRLSPNFVRVTFRGDDLADLGWDGPDQRIKVILPLPGIGIAELPDGDDWYERWRRLPDDARNPMRTYTIRSADRHARELVVDFVAHGDSGPASRWIGGAAVGDELLVIGPDATSDEDSGGYEWRPGRATTLLVAGDETATPAVAAILESLPDDARGAVFLEVPTRADVLPLRVPAGVELTWVARDDGGDAGYGERLSGAVRAWADAWISGAGGAHRGADVAAPAPDEILWEVPAAPDAPGLYAWLAGEAGAITGIRRHLVRELGIDRSRVAFMGYWKIGRAEN
jgi:NADPH-dependent ferric siderophore reductase